MVARYSPPLGKMIMLECFYCHTPLPAAYRKVCTQKIIENAICSPFCKIRNQIITIDDMGCWLFRRHIFTWGCRSYSVKKYVYYHAYHKEYDDPDLILMRCNNNKCANPDHMEGFGKKRLDT